MALEIEEEAIKFFGGKSLIGMKGFDLIKRD